MSRRRTENVRSEVAYSTGNVKYKLLLSSLVETSSRLLEHRPELFKKSPTIYYFSKCDSDETICEKITRLNILPNQFYAVLAIFSAPKRGRATAPPAPPAPPPLISQLVFSSNGNTNTEGCPKYTVKKGLSNPKFYLEAMA